MYLLMQDVRTKIDLFANLALILCVLLMGSNMSFLLTFSNLSADLMRPSTKSKRMKIMMIEVPQKLHVLMMNLLVTFPSTNKVTC